jgi:hypothetical protein
MEFEMAGQEDFKSLRMITYKVNCFSLEIRPLEESHAEIIHATVVLSRENFLPFMCWVHGELSVIDEQTLL